MPRSDGYGRRHLCEYDPDSDTYTMRVMTYRTFIKVAMTCGFLIATCLWFIVAVIWHASNGGWS